MKRMASSASSSLRRYHLRNHVYDDEDPTHQEESPHNCRSVLESTYPLLVQEYLDANRNPHSLHCVNGSGYTVGEACRVSLGIGNWEQCSIQPILDGIPGVYTVSVGVRLYDSVYSHKCLVEVVAPDLRHRYQKAWGYCLESYPGVFGLRLRLLHASWRQSLYQLVRLANASYDSLSMYRRLLPVWNDFLDVPAWTFQPTRSKNIVSPASYISWIVARRRTPSG